MVALGPNFGRRYVWAADRRSQDETNPTVLLRGGPGGVFGGPGGGFRGFLGVVEVGAKPLLRLSPRKPRKP